MATATPAITPTSTPNIGGHLLRSAVDLELEDTLDNAEATTSIAMFTGAPATVEYTALFGTGSGTIKVKIASTAVAAVDFGSGTIDTVACANGVRGTAVASTTAANPYFAVKITDGGNMGGSVLTESYGKHLVQLKGGKAAASFEGIVNATVPDGDGALVRTPV